MMPFMIKNLIIIVLSLWNGIVAVEYTIQRRVTRYQDTLTDNFTIPSSVCSGDGSAQCTDMGGTKFKDCECECSEDRSTFGFYDTRWKCAKNEQVHKHSGCTIMLDYRKYMDSIITVQRQRNYNDYYLPTISSSANCKVTTGSSFMCNGTWGQPSTYFVKNRFALGTEEDNLYLYNKKGLDIIKGQVIRLQIACKSPTSNHCVILKIKGTTTCPIPPTQSPPTTTAPPPTEVPTVPTTLAATTTAGTTQPPPMTIKKTTRATTLTVTTTTLTPRHITTTTTTTAAAALTTPRHHTSSPGLQTRPSITTGLISTVAHNNHFSSGNKDVSGTRDGRSITTTSSVFGKKYNKSPSKKNNNSGLIAGALAGVIGLAILIAIIVVMKRRKEGKSSAKTTDTVENAGYEKGVDNSLRITERGQQSHDEDEYAYAYTRNAVPFENTNKQDTGDHSYNNRALESNSSVANHVYGKTETLQRSPPHIEAPINNTLEEPEYARPNKSRKVNQTSADAPIYNTLEEPEYAKVNKGGHTKLSENKNEPLYNVLEGPDAEHDEKQSEEPPCYHVLEGPFPDGAPVYDVLEGPEPGEAPVYGSLDGPDPHVYGTLDMCDTEGAFKDNREYNDIVYDSVGEAVNDTGDIYQQLNQSGQGGSDVYQGLSYPDKTMYLKELTESHSNV